MGALAALAAPGLGLKVAEALEPLGLGVQLAGGIRPVETLDGTVEFMVDGRWRTYTAGAHATVPPGSLHSFRNRSVATARLRDVHRPALRSSSTSSTSTC